MGWGCRGVWEQHPTCSVRQPGQETQTRAKYPWQDFLRPTVLFLPVLSSSGMEAEPWRRQGWPTLPLGGASLEDQNSRGPSKTTRGGHTTGALPGPVPCTLHGAMCVQEHRVQSGRGMEKEGSKESRNLPPNRHLPGAGSKLD